MIYKDIAKNIEKLRKKLYENINKYGIDSKEVKEIIVKLDDMINIYYSNIRKRRFNIVKYEYNISYNKLVELTKKNGKFPTIKKWDEYAKKYNYLTNTSLKYISNLNWHGLRSKVINEKNYTSSSE